MIKMQSDGGGCYFAVHARLAGLMPVWSRLGAVGACPDSLVPGQCRPRPLCAALPLPGAFVVLAFAWWLANAIGKCHAMAVPVISHVQGAWRHAHVDRTS